MESKEKGMNEYTILSSHQTRQRMKVRENVKRRMDILYLLIPTTKQNQEDRLDRGTNIYSDYPHTGKERAK